MRFFEVDSAVDAIMSAAMLAQTKAGSRNQQGQLSMNGFLQMLKNAGIVMDYEGFKTVYDTNPQLANVIEKFDKDTVTFMSADGNDKAVDNTKASNQPSPDERITQMARSAVRTREFKESIVNEEGFSDDMIKKLRAAYEPLKGKKIPPLPLMKIFDKIDYNVKGLIQLYKADIPFVSMMAMSRLMLKHDYKADDINKLGSIRREEVEGIDESGILYKAGVKKYTKPGMQKIQSAAGKGASAEEIGRIKDKYNKKKKVTADVHEDDTADYEKVNARRMIKQLRAISEHRRMLENMIIKLADMNKDSGDLTDQLQTMFDLNTKFSGVLRRSMSIVPVYEGEMNEAIPTSEYDYDIKKFFDKVQELEDENQHGEVAKMLTQLYGTNAELMIINGINAMHANEGSIGPEAQKLRDKISTKYYYQAQKEVEKLKKTSPAYTMRNDQDGPDEEQRDRTRASNTDEGFASDAQRKAAFASGYKPKGKKKTEDIRMNRFGKLEYDTDYSDIPNELEDDFDMKKLEKEFEKALKNKNESMQSKFKNFLAEGMKEKIAKDIDNGMSTDAIIGKHANKRTDNTDEIRKIIKDIKFKKRMKNESIYQSKRSMPSGKQVDGAYSNDPQTMDEPNVRIRKTVGDIKPTIKRTVKGLAHKYSKLLNPPLKGKK